MQVTQSVHIAKVDLTDAGVRGTMQRLMRPLVIDAPHRPLPPEGHQQIIPSHRAGFCDPTVTADCLVEHTGPKTATVTTRLLLRGEPLIIVEMHIYDYGPAVFLRRYAPHLLERELRDRWFRRQTSWATRAGAMLRNEWPDFAPLPKPDLADVEREIRAFETSYPPHHPHAANVALWRAKDVIEEMGDFVCLILLKETRDEVMPFVVSRHDHVVWVERLVARWAAKAFGETPESMETRAFVDLFADDPTTA